MSCNRFSATTINIVADIHIPWKKHMASPLSWTDHHIQWPKQSLLLLWALRTCFSSWRRQWSWCLSLCCISVSLTEFQTFIATASNISTDSIIIITMLHSMKQASLHWLHEHTHKFQENLNHFAKLIIILMWAMGIDGLRENKQIAEEQFKKSYLAHWFMHHVSLLNIWLRLFGHNTFWNNDSALQSQS